MNFFQKERPEVFLHSAKLRRDKKTGRRFWRLTLIVTMDELGAVACGGAIERGWQYISNAAASAEEVKLDEEIDLFGVDCFAERDDATPVLHLEQVTIDSLRFTRDGKVVEFWFELEHENVGGIHDFLKPYAFTRFWAAFTLPQLEMFPIPAQPIARAN